MRHIARVTEDELERNIARNLQKKPAKKMTSNVSQKKFQHKSQTTLLLSVVSNLVHEDGERYFRGFEQYIGKAINVAEFVTWLETLKKENISLTYKNIAALTTVRDSEMALQLQAARRDALRNPRQQCICGVGDGQILEWIQNQCVPEGALYNGCCWVRVCQVRGRNLPEVEEETWEEICRTRGYLKF